MLEWCNFQQSSPQMMAVFVIYTKKLIIFIYIIELMKNKEELEKKTGAKKFEIGRAHV